MEQNIDLKQNGKKRDPDFQLSELAIESMIIVIRNQQVMLDHDSAMLYDVGTKALNKAVKRNSERFPVNFRFQLSEEETFKLVTNCDRLERHSRSLKDFSKKLFAFSRIEVEAWGVMNHE